MSVRVLSRVFCKSESELGARLVMLALADSSHDDGVTWISQNEIAAKTLLSVRQVQRCVKELQEQGEIEVRKAQRGRRRINVYRVTLAVEYPDYESLPFVLAEPFSGHDIMTGRNADDTTYATSTTRHIVRDSLACTKDLTVRGNRKKTLAAAPRKRDVVFDAMALATDSDPQLEGSAIAKACNQLRKHVGYIEYAEQHGQEEAETKLAAAIPLQAENYQEHFHGMACTPSALVRHWKRIRKPRLEGRGLTPEQMMKRAREEQS